LKCVQLSDDGAIRKAASFTSGRIGVFKEVLPALELN